MKFLQNLLTTSLALSFATVATVANAAFTIDLTGNDAYDGQNPLGISFIDGSNSAIISLVPTGGAFNSNTSDFGIGDDQIDGTSEVVTITFDKEIEFNFIDFGGVGADTSDGVSLTVGATSLDLFTGVAGFNGTTNEYAPASPISLATGDSIIITGSSGTSSFDIQTLNVSVVPELSTYPLLAGVCGLTFVMLKRRRDEHL